MIEITVAIPNADALLKAIDGGCTNHGSAIHGPEHWRAVAWTGLELLAETPEAEPAVVLLFAMFHDSMRLNDGHDPQHGPRAAVFADSLHGVLFHLPKDQLSWLIRAIHDHTSGRFAANHSIACCWDADRLNLWRIGVRPIANFLTTPAARRSETIDRARKLEGQNYPWGQIVERYRQLK